MTKATIGEAITYTVRTSNGDYPVQGHRVIIPGFEKFQFGIGSHPGVNDGRPAVTEISTGRKIAASEETEEKALKAAQWRLGRETPKTLKEAIEAVKAGLK